MRFHQEADGSWTVVYEDGRQLRGFASAGEASTAADALVASRTVTAAAPAATAVATAPPSNGAVTDAEAIIAAITASTVDVPARPPDAWFTNPGFTAATTLPAPGCSDVRGCPVTITDEGQVFGHMALWNTCHNGDPRGPGVCVPPPHSSPNYPEFRRGEVLTASGARIATGPLTVGTGHADIHLDRQAAARHYDDTGTIVADVNAGEDEYGIWVAGTIRPGATIAQVEALRRTPLSGDWRDKDGRHELVAALAVPSPGFSVPRHGLALAASLTPRANIIPAQDGQPPRVTALVAAGAQILADIQASPWTGVLEEFRTELDELRGYVQPAVIASDRARLDAAFGDPVTAAAPPAMPLDTPAQVKAAWAKLADMPAPLAAQAKPKILAAAKRLNVTLDS